MRVLDAISMFLGGINRFEIWHCLAIYSSYHALRISLQGKKTFSAGARLCKKSAISNIFLTNCKSQSKEPFVKEVLQRGCLLHQAASACHTRLYWRNINPPCKSRCAHDHKWLNPVLILTLLNFSAPCSCAKAKSNTKNPNFWSFVLMGNCD